MRGLARRTGTGACPYDGWRQGVRRTQRSGNDEVAVGRCGAIRVICVIRLIRDSDTAGR